MTVRRARRGDSLAFAMLLVGLALLVAAPRARAEPTGRAGTVRLEMENGGRGPLVLQPFGPSFVGALLIRNVGRDPLVVSRVAVRGDVADPRAPRKVTTRLDGGSFPQSVEPGGVLRATVRWEPAGRARQLFGHVVVTTSDEASGEVAIGITAQQRGAFGRLEGHVLSLGIAAPLFGALVILLLRGGGVRSSRLLHGVACSALGVHALIALYVYRTFVPDFSRLDGNDGLQLVEHVVWSRSLGAELFLGVDGMGVAPLLTTAVVALAALLPERSSPRAPSLDYAAYLVLAGSTMGAFVAADGLVLVLFVTTALAAATLLVGSRARPDAARAAVAMALLGLLVVAAMLLAVFVLARSADPTFLVDGTKTMMTFGLPDLSRVGASGRGALWGIRAPSRFAFGLVVFASVVLLGVFPFHRWLGRAVLSSQPAASALLFAGLPSLGAAVLVRLGCMVAPEAARAASGVLVAYGVVAAATGALLAFGEPELRRLVVAAGTSLGGFVLVGVGSLAPMGLAGAMAGGPTRGLASALFVLALAGIEARTRTTDVASLRGLGRKLPGWSVALGAAAVGQSAVFGGAAGWGPWLAVLGALSNYLPLALAAALALLLLAAAHIQSLTPIFFGGPGSRPESDPEPAAEPPMPDITPREWTAIAPLVTIVLMLGFWPAPVLSLTAGTVRDLIAILGPATGEPATP